MRSNPADLHSPRARPTAAALANCRHRPSSGPGRRPETPWGARLIGTAARRGRDGGAGSALAVSPSRLDRQASSDVGTSPSGAGPVDEMRANMRDGHGDVDEPSAPGMDMRPNALILRPALAEARSALALWFASDIGTTTTRSNDPRRTTVEARPRALDREPLPVLPALLRRHREKRSAFRLRMRQGAQQGTGKASLLDHRPALGRQGTAARLGRGFALLAPRITRF